MRAILLLLLAFPALAQTRNPPAPPRPEPVPLMDIAVTYRATLEDRADAPLGETRIAYHLASATWRIQPAQPGIHFLVDRRAGRALMVMERRRAFLVMTEGGTLVQDVEAAFAAGTAERGGQLRILNTPCTIWRLRDAGSVCLSARGVMLRRESPGGGWMEATQLDLTTQDGERFRPPEGFRAITIEQMLGAP
jgi:hypothetical protein